VTTVRRYQEYCSLARTLDLVGDRWTLLIVRELALRPCRYTDLRDGLPGIATNLLAERLRELTAAGVVTAETAPPPVATTLYTLTDWGAGLWPILMQLGRWGAPLMAPGQGDDHFRSHWAAVGATAVYSDVDLAGLEPLTVLIDTGHGHPALIRAEPTGLTADAAPTRHGADLVLGTDPDTTVALLTGATSPDQLDPDTRARVRGADDALRRFTALTARAAQARTARVATAPP